MIAFKHYFSTFFVLSGCLAALSTGYAQCNFPSTPTLINNSFESVSSGRLTAWSVEGVTDRNSSVSFSRSNGYQKCGYYYGLLTYNGTSTARVWQDVELPTGATAVSLVMWGGIHSRCNAEFRLIFLRSNGSEIERQVQSVTKNVDTNPRGLGQYTLNATVPANAKKVRVEAGMRRVTTGPQGSRQEGIYLKMDAAVLTFITPPLPVTLSQFKAGQTENAVRLDWQTTRESNSGAFEVQHSIDAKSWNVLEEVAAGGDYDGILNYNYTHRLPAAGQNYYRLRMVDLDGSSEMSGLVSVEYRPARSQASEMFVYPNPSSGKIYVRVASGAKEVSVSDITGRSIFRAATLNDRDEIDLSKVETGAYFVSWSDSRGQKVVQRVLISR